MLGNELVMFMVPLVVGGLVHHLIIIPYDRFHWLRIPIDRGHRIGGKRIFGDSKTWRGIVVMLIVPALIMPIVQWFVVVPLFAPAWLAGGLLGLGYSAGELPNSFIKRRTEKRSAFVDHIDSVIGALIVLPIIHRPSLSLVITVFVLGTLMHWSVDILLHRYGYKRLKETV